MFQQAFVGKCSLEILGKELRAMVITSSNDEHVVLSCGVKFSRVTGLFIFYLFINNSIHTTK